MRHIQANEGYDLKGTMKTKYSLTHSSSIKNSNLNFLSQKIKMKAQVVQKVVNK